MANEAISESTTPNPVSLPAIGESDSPAIIKAASSSQTDTPVPTTPSRRENIRPKFIGRQHSGSIIVPRDAVPMPTPAGEYPPDDARAMSPRRTSEETEKLGEETRLAVQK